MSKVQKLLVNGEEVTLSSEVISQDVTSLLLPQPTTEADIGKTVAVLPDLSYGLVESPSPASSAVTLDEIISSTESATPEQQSQLVANIGAQPQIDALGLIKCRPDGSVLPAVAGLDYLTDGTCPELHTSFDTGWLPITNGVYVRNCNGTVTIIFTDSFHAVNGPANKPVIHDGIQIPARFRSSQEMRFVVSIDNQFAQIIVSPDGTMKQLTAFEATSEMYLSGTITYTAIILPSIVKQPADTTVSVGESATFRVIANVSSASYQWYYALDPVSGDTEIEGANTNTLTIEVPDISYSGRIYRCAVSRDGVDDVSDYAELTVNS